MFYMSSGVGDAVSCWMWGSSILTVTMTISRTSWVELPDAIHNYYTYLPVTWFCVHWTAWGACSKSLRVYLLMVKPVKVSDWKFIFIIFRIINLEGFGCLKVCNRAWLELVWDFVSFCTDVSERLHTAWQVDSCSQQLRRDNQKQCLFCFWISMIFAQLVSIYSPCRLHTVEECRRYMLTNIQHFTAEWWTWNMSPWVVLDRPLRKQVPYGSYDLARDQWEKRPIQHSPTFTFLFRSRTTAVSSSPSQGRNLLNVSGLRKIEWNELQTHPMEQESCKVDPFLSL